MARRGNGLDQKGRTLATTVDDLLLSPRMQLAVALYEKDKSHMRAILIELGMAAQTVGRNCTIRRVAAWPLGKEDMLIHLRQLTDYEGYSSWWNLSPEEAQLYLDSANRKLSEEDRRALLEKVAKRFGLEL